MTSAGAPAPPPLLATTAAPDRGRWVRTLVAVGLSVGAGLSRAAPVSSGVARTALLVGAALVTVLAVSAVPIIARTWRTAAAAVLLGAGAIGSYRLGAVYPFTMTVAAAGVAGASLVSWQPTRHWPVRRTTVAAFALVPLIGALAAWTRGSGYWPTLGVLVGALAVTDLYGRTPLVFDRLERPVRRAVRGAGRRLAEAGRSARIPKRSEIDRRGVGLILAPVALAAVLWLRGGDERRIVILLLVALLAGVGAVWFPRAIDRVFTWVRRGAELVADGIVYLLSGLVLLLGIVPLHVLSRLVGYDPLSRGWQNERTAFARVEPGRFRHPDGTPVDPTGMASVDTPLEPKVRRRSRARLVIGVLPVVLLTGVVVQQRSSPDGRTLTTGKGGDTFTGRFEEAPAFEGAPWAQDLRMDLLDSWNNIEFNDAPGWALKDGTSEYIDVEDRQRRTVLPDPALGEPLEVWFFGGSAAFGAGQRDEHTVPSELVRRAGNQGRALRIRNFGVPATVNWQSTVLAIEQLMWAERPPDLIVFYDGANDLALQNTLVAAGKGLADDPASLYDEQFDEILRDRADEKGAPASTAAPVTPDPGFDVLTPAQIGGAVATRYGRGVAVASTFAATKGVPVIAFWQPVLSTKAPLSAADLEVAQSVGLDRAALAQAAAVSAEARARLAAAPEEIIDLSGAFDGLEEPIYWDSVHTNELGAQVVAEKMYPHLLQALGR